MRDRLAVDHTASNTLDPIRTPLLSDARPGQYWAGGPPGNTTELTAFCKSPLDVPIVGFSGRVPKSAKKCTAVLRAIGMSR